MAASEKRALIRGVFGQDGAYLARLLLEKGCTVSGTSRDAELSAFPNLRALNIRDRVKTLSVAVTDFRSVLQRDAAEDFVIATGESHSLEAFTAAVFERLDLDWRAHVVRDDNLSRPTDLRRSCGDPAKANRTRGWTARHERRRAHHGGRRERGAQRLMPECLVGHTEEDARKCAA